MLSKSQFSLENGTAPVGQALIETFDEDLTLVRFR